MNKLAVAVIVASLIAVATATGLALAGTSGRAAPTCGVELDFK